MNLERRKLPRITSLKINALVNLRILTPFEKDGFKIMRLELLFKNELQLLELDSSQLPPQIHRDGNRFAESSILQSRIAFNGHRQVGKLKKRLRGAQFMGTDELQTIPTMAKKLSKDPPPLSQITPAPSAPPNNG